jgi:hypothetical protein
MTRVRLVILSISKSKNEHRDSISHLQYHNGNNPVVPVCRVGWTLFCHRTSETALSSDERESSSFSELLHFMEALKERSGDFWESSCVSHGSACMEYLHFAGYLDIDRGITREIYGMDYLYSDIPLRFSLFFLET